VVGYKLLFGLVLLLGALLAAAAPAAGENLTFPIVAAVFAAAATYLGVRWRLSGRIGRSEASDLWDESTKMRQELRDEVVYLRGLVEDLETKLNEHEVKLMECQARMRALQRGERRGRNDA
jgi:hypothetical protein